jgi:multicomponent Na+:H+ antiporter subunit E
MRVFLLNLLFALLWAAAVGSVDTAHLVVGYVAGYGVLWLARPVLGPSGYFRRLPRAVGFAGFFLWELVLSNLRVAWDVLTPRSYRRPGVVAVPLDATTDVEITLLANLVTLTPGTLSLDVSPDRRVLYVHGMFVDDPETMRRDIKQSFERRVLGLLR